MSGDIPRAEVERVLEDLRAPAAHYKDCYDTAYLMGLAKAAEKVALLLKPKQYKKEWWVGINNRHETLLFWTTEPSDYDKSNCVSLRHYTDTLEHGEGIE